MRRPLAFTAVRTLIAGVMVLTVACSDDSRGAKTIEGPTAPTTPATTSAAPAADVTTTIPRPAGDPSDVTVRLVEVATLDEPTALVPRSMSDNLYATERAGLVRMLRREGDAFEVADEPVLDITDMVDAEGERGLLGMAFSPDGTELFVSYTDDTDDGASVVAAYPLVLVGDVFAEVEQRREILRLPQPYPNHNGGNIAFGPDGYLYLGFGDGGNQGDPDDRAQDPSDLLGKILRIDVSASSAETPYAVPADNPFVGDDTARWEVWTRGLRNPWRFSFDRLNGDLWIGDVGGGEWEEVDHLPAGPGGAGRGANLGWSLREGAHDTDKDGARPNDLIDPVFEYDHSEGNSITGGFVYRGSAVPALSGIYVFADFYTAELRGLVVRDGELAAESTIDTRGAEPSQIASFGEDADGELYVLSLAGPILRVTAP